MQNSPGSHHHPNGHLATPTDAELQVMAEQLLASELSRLETGRNDHDHGHGHGHGHGHIVTSLPSVDLRTLLSEMVSLKAEVRAESKAVREVRDQLGEATAHISTHLQSFGQHQQADHEAQLARVVAKSERHAAEALIDIADRLEASSRQTPPPPPRMPRWLWPFQNKALRQLAATLEGLDVTRARVAERLADLGVERIHCVGQPFDSETMEAVETTSVPEAAALSVVEEVLAGYRFCRGQGASALVRRAQVIVNKP